MEVQYVYMRTRQQFGKQCIFDDYGPMIDENIFPNAELALDYIAKDPCHQASQKSTQLALHEMQTCQADTKMSGMLHVEGGWPKEVNYHDEEATTRFRRRVEKDEAWGPRMKNLIQPMEHCVLQNNAVNIYDNYFDDMVPTELVLPLGVRVTNVYLDPQTNVRPITHLSWSPDHGKRLAVSYCCMEFQKKTDLSPYSYIWDVDNPNQAFMALKAFCPSVVIEFNPRDPSMLISGLMSGQVCNWDIRTGNRPVQISHLQFSHRNPANLVLWINSKTNSEFFSASTGGQMKWWDIRKLREPTESLVLDLQNPLRSDVVKATGVSAIQFEPTMGTKFMAGLENGVVISGTRKGKNAQEKLALRFNCHYGPVVQVDRNPFSTKNFLTVGDWSVRIWAEDTKEGSLVSTPYYKDLLTGGCWSMSRYSVFYVINMGGQLDMWDILVGMDHPVTSIRLCDDSLKAIKPHEEGKLVAVGNDKGSVYLVEASEALTINGRNDKVLATAYLDRCSRFEKAIDNRLKEVRLAQRVVYEQEMDIPMKPPGKGKGAGKEKVDKGKPGKVDSADKVDNDKDKGKDKDKDKDKGKDKGKDKAKGKDKDKGKDKGKDKDKKKGKGKKGKDAQTLPDDPELAEAEIQYYNTIQKEIEKYANVEDPDYVAPSPPPMPEGSKKKKHDDKSEKEKKGDKGGKVDKGGKGAKNDKSGEIVLMKKKPDTVLEAYDSRLKRSELIEQDKQSEDLAWLEEERARVDAEKRGSLKRSKKPRSPKSFRLPSTKPCTEVCRPKVCCKDVKIPGPAKKPEEEKEGLVETEEATMTSSHVLLSSKEMTKEQKRQALKEIDARPDVLDKDVFLAKKELREDVARMKEARKGPPKSRTPVKETEVADEDVPGEAIEEQVDEDKPKESSELEIAQEDEAPEAPKKKKHRHPKPRLGPCEPQKPTITVEESIGTKAPKKMLKSEGIDFGYKVKHVEEQVYPRISAAQLDKIPPLEELLLPTSSPPSSTPEHDMKKFKFKFKSKSKSKSVFKSK